MTEFMFHCGRCDTPLSVPVDVSTQSVTCPSCQTAIFVDVFNALFQPMQTGSAGEAIITDTESSCFYHPEKKAAAICATCGRFLCALCDIDFAGRHLCATCLETGEKKEKIQTLKRHATRYDSIAAAIAIVPLIFVYPTLITAPIALVYVIKYWNAPQIIPFNRWRFVVAFIAALLEIGGWVWFALALWAW